MKQCCLKHVCVSASCTLPPDKFPPKDDNKQKAKKLVLNSGEGLFGEIRDMNFTGVGTVLSREAKRITTEYEVGLLTLY